MTTWSPTSSFNRRAYDPENLSPMPQKDFCNKICQQQTKKAATFGDLVDTTPYVSGSDVKNVL
jgi:hypothetical protein